MKTLFLDGCGQKFPKSNPRRDICSSYRCFQNLKTAEPSRLPWKYLKCCFPLPLRPFYWLSCRQAMRCERVSGRKARWARLGRSRSRLLNPIGVMNGAKKRRGRPRKDALGKEGGLWINGALIKKIVSDLQIRLTKTYIIRLISRLRKALSPTPAFCSRRKGAYKIGLDRRYCLTKGLRKLTNKTQCYIQNAKNPLVMRVFNLQLLKTG